MFPLSTIIVNRQSNILLTWLLINRLALSFLLLFFFALMATSCFLFLIFIQMHDSVIVSDFGEVAYIRQGMQHFEGGKLALEAVLDLRRNPARLVEAADGHADAVVLEIGIGQRRAAIRAEAALDGLGTLEDAKLALRPDQILARHAGK